MRAEPDGHAVAVAAADTLEVAAALGEEADLLECCLALVQLCHHPALAGQAAAAQQAATLYGAH